MNGRDISFELAECIDVVSVSLNNPDPTEYQKIVRSRFGESAYPAMISFAKNCASKGIRVVMTTVDTTISHEDEAKCRDICESIGVEYRIRAYES